MQTFEINTQPESNTPLWSYLKEKTAFLCLGCTLPICVEDGGKGRCAYLIGKSRSGYFMDRYIRDREKILGHPIIEVECKEPDCTVMILPYKAKSGYCKRHYKYHWDKAKRAIRKMKREVMNHG